MNKTVIRTAVISSIITAILTTAAIFGFLWIQVSNRQAESLQAQSAQTPQQGQPTAQEQQPEQAHPSAQEQPGPAPSAEAAAKKPITRDAFDALVLDKTKDDVINAVGKPDSTFQQSDITIWNFQGVTYDPVTGKVDEFTTIDFHNGIATSAGHH